MLLLTLLSIFCLGIQIFWLPANVQFVSVNADEVLTTFLAQGCLPYILPWVCIREYYPIHWNDMPTYTPCWRYMYKKNDICRSHLSASLLVPESISAINIDSVKLNESLIIMR